MIGSNILSRALNAPTVQQINILLGNKPTNTYIEELHLLIILPLCII